MAEGKPVKGSGNLAVWVVLFILALALGGGLIYYIRSGGPEEKIAQEILPESTTTTDQVGIGGEEKPKVVDLNQTGTESEQAKEMERRKEELGVKKSLDAVVKEEEKVKIGDKTVSMARIVDQIKAREKGGEAATPEETAATAESPKSPEIVEEDLGTGKTIQRQKAAAPKETAAGSGGETAAGNETRQQADGGESAVSKPIKDITLAEIKEGAAQEPAKYGIHLVLPGENLWNVHLEFLREYFAKKGIKLAKGADKPGRGGKSSGVARILKYAEKMVFIYSLKDNKLSDNLDLIRPNEKIVVFNIGRLDSILRTLDAEKIKRVRLDGDTLTLE